MTLIMTFDIECDLGSSILFQKWILEVRIIWKNGITLLSRHISSKVAFSSVFDMLIICQIAIMQIKKFPKVAVMPTLLNFLLYTYRFRISNKTLCFQSFPGSHFGSWTIANSGQKPACSKPYMNSNILAFRHVVNSLPKQLSNVIPLWLLWSYREPLFLYKGIISP